MGEQMAVYIVAVELEEERRNYPCISGRLAALKHRHAQQTVWFVDFAGTPKELRDHLKDCLTATDRLFVGAISNDWAGHNMPGAGGWLRDNGL
jgi:hypothetical protein